ADCLLLMLRCFSSNWRSSSRSRRARLRALVDRQVIGSRRALALTTNPGRFLSTVQVGITLVGVLSGAFSRATLGLRLAEWFVDLGVRASVRSLLIPKLEDPDSCYRRGHWDIQLQKCTVVQWDMVALLGRGRWCR